MLPSGSATGRVAGRLGPPQRAFFVSFCAISNISSGA